MTAYECKTADVVIHLAVTVPSRYFPLRLIIQNHCLFTWLVWQTKLNVYDVNVQHVVHRPEEVMAIRMLMPWCTLPQKYNISIHQQASLDQLYVCHTATEEDIFPLRYMLCMITDKNHCYTVSTCRKLLLTIMRVSEGAPFHPPLRVKPIIYLYKSCLFWQSFHRTCEHLGYNLDI